MLQGWSWAQGQYFAARADRGHEGARAEIAARVGELAEVHDGWILLRIKQLADCSIANFLLLDADGTLKLDRQGRPQLDFKKVTAKSLRAILGFEFDARGRFKFKLRDPMPALELLARNRGLLLDKTAIEAPARMYVIADRPYSEDEWAKLCVRPG